MKLYILPLMLIPMLLVANIGTVAGVKGDSKIHRHTKVIKAKNGIAIKLKDTVKTGNNSKTQVIMKDKTIITIGENSEYSFDKYSYGRGQTPEVSMQLKKGFFRAITGKIAKVAPKRFHIKTRSATIGIRGTHFYGIVKGDEEKIGCIRGKVIVYTKLKNYILIAGQSVTLHNGLWNMTMLPKSKAKSKAKTLKAKKHEASKELQNRDVLINSSQGIDIDSGSIPTPPDTPSYNPDIQ